jgi:peptidoglycan/xylan/chitin deacetylase (PgdA/CDA1 family)
MVRDMGKRVKSTGSFLRGVVLALGCLSGVSMASNEVPLPEPELLPQVIYHGSRSEKRVAITFDACSSPHGSKVDKKLVQILVNNRIPATLFLGGKWVLDQPQEARYLASIPFFEIASHSFHHPHLTRMTPRAIEHELLAAQNAIESVTGVRPQYFRAPYGEYNGELVRIAASLGLTTIQFDLASGDPDKNITADRLSHYVIHSVKGGSIVVMHINTHGWHTADALPTIVKGLRAKGYHFVTVSELLEQPFQMPDILLASNDSKLLIDPVQIKLPTFLLP